MAADLQSHSTTMTTFKHILFPVDFSNRCQAVRADVLAMAHQFNARITLLHTIQIPAAWYGGIEGLYYGAFNNPAIQEDVRRKLGPDGVRTRINPSRFPPAHYNLELLRRFAQNRAVCSGIPVAGIAGGFDGSC